MTSCVDLAAVIGTRDRLRKEADGASWFETPEDERPWLLELACVAMALSTRVDDRGFAFADPSHDTVPKIHRTQCRFSARARRRGV